MSDEIKYRKLAKIISSGEGDLADFLEFTAMEIRAGNISADRGLVAILDEEGGMGFGIQGMDYAEIAWVAAYLANHSVIESEEV